MITYTRTHQKQGYKEWYAKRNETESAEPAK